MSIAEVMSITLDRKEQLLKGVRRSLTAVSLESPGISMKRLVDIVLSMPLIVIGLPFLVSAAAALLIVQGPPLFFLQRRAGYKGVPFTLYKLRTMQLGAGPDGERLTAIGTVVRAFSLDELPQLWNVLRGDMSLVGPRPLLVDYVERYSKSQRHRLDVPPGITGWAQVNGRNAITWEGRFVLDVWYVENRTMALDLWILVLTAWQVISRRGISAPGEPTMPEFTGTSGEGSAA